MDKRKTHYGISKGICGNRRSWRTNSVAGVTCLHCVKRLKKVASAFSS